MRTPAHMPDHRRHPTYRRGSVLLQMTALFVGNSVSLQGCRSRER